MKKKIPTVAGAMIILVIAVLAGVLLWQYENDNPEFIQPFVHIKKNAKKNNQPDAAVSQQLSSQTQQTQSDLVYTNNKYGFQLTLPGGWENYKAIENNMPGTIFFLLPTKDKTWAAPDNSGKDSKSGYADVFSIDISTIGDWTKTCVPKCDREENGPGCYICTDYVAKNSKYVFTFYPPQTLPNDLQNSSIVMDTKSIQKGFKLLNQ